MDYPSEPMTPRSRRRDGSPEQPRAPLLELKSGNRTWPITIGRLVVILSLVGMVWTGCQAVSSKVLWPWATPASIAEIRHEMKENKAATDSVIAIIRDEHRETREQIREMSFHQHTTSYTLCVFLRRAGPDLLTSDCVQTINDARARDRMQRGQRENNGNGHN